MRSFRICSGCCVWGLLCCLSPALSGQVIAQSALPRLQEVRIIGAEADEGPALFSRIQSVTAGPDGEIFVLDALAPRIRAFDREGTCFIETGIEGSGPGETRLPIALLLAPDGSFTVLDMRLNRVTRFGPDGSLLDTRPIPAIGSSTLRSAVGDPTGIALYYVHLDFRTFSTVISKPTTDGNELEDVMRVEEWPLKVDGSPAMFYPLAAGPGGVLAIGDGDLAYEIRIFDSKGRPLRTIEREIARRHKTDEEIEREEERLEQGADRIAREGGREAMMTRPETDPLKHYFYADALRFDDTERLWILTGRGDENRSVFDLFAPDGSFLGEVEVDRVISRYDIRGPWLVASGFTAEGVPVAVLYRID